MKVRTCVLNITNAVRTGLFEYFFYYKKQRHCQTYNLLIFRKLTKKKKTKIK